MKYADKGDFEKVNIFGTGAPMTRTQSTLLVIRF